MKNKLKCLLIDLLPLVLWVVAAVFLVSYAVYDLKLLLIKGMVVCLLGIILNYYLSLFFHELGHLVFARANKMSAQKINFGIVSINKNTKKLKFFTTFGINAGESEFLPNGKLSEGQLKSVAFGGLLFNAIYVLGVLAVMIFVKEPTVLCLFGAGGVSACYLLTVNILPFDKTSDGAVVLRKEYPKAVVEVSNLFDAINNDEPLEKSEFVKNSKQPLAIYCDFFITSLDKAKEAVNIIKQIDLDLLATDQEYSLFFPEVLYLACLEGQISEKLKARAENYFSCEQLTVCDLRAHYAYRRALGEIEWANSIKLGYEQALNALPVKRRQSENNLIELFNLKFSK